MIKLHKELQDIISNVVRDKEKELNNKLNIEDFDFLIDVCAEFVETNIHKYIAGNAEHGDGFLNTVDHIGELYKEQLDGFNYLAAIRWNKRRHDRRH